MYTFHLVASPKESLSAYEPLFASACKMLGVELHTHDPDHVKFLDLERLGTRDLLYNASFDKKSKAIARMLISSECTHFYKDTRLAFTGRGVSWFLHRDANIPTPSTIVGIPLRDEYPRVPEILGGFPVIVKVAGGTKGVGVMRADSLESLGSILDYVRGLDVTVLLRKYIPHDYYVRAVVVDDRVVASHATEVLRGEFRSNTGNHDDSHRRTYDLPAHLQEVAVRAVHVTGVETGGVDFVFEKNGNAYVTEVNFPNNFTFTQKVTGVDIAKEMVSYLLCKAKK